MVAPAAGYDGEMHGGRFVAVPVEQLGQRPQLVQGNVGGAAALLTHEVMMMTLTRQVDHTRSLAEVDVVGDTRLLEGVDRPVDRRQVDRSAQGVLG